MTIGPVVLLGLLSIFFMLTTVRSSMMEEIEEGLKGTAAATLAAYDQNTGDYMESSNGDIWKGSYNISHSESLVDRIKDNTGMDVTFFYGDRRIMTSALDSNGYTYVNIGSIMRRIGEYQEGYKYYLQADEIFKKGGFIDDKIKNRHNIGISQYHLGHPQKGIEILTALLLSLIHI